MTMSLIDKFLSSQVPHRLKPGVIPNHKLIKIAFKHYGQTYSWEIDCISLLPDRAAWLQIKKDLPDFLGKIGYGPEIFVNVPEYTSPTFDMSNGSVIKPIQWEEPTSEYMKIRRLSPSSRDTFQRGTAKEMVFDKWPETVEQLSVSVSFDPKSHWLHEDMGLDIQREFEKFSLYGFEISLDSFDLNSSATATNLAFTLLTWIAKKCDASLAIYDEAGLFNPFFYYHNAKDTWHYGFQE